jgi:hypothetical protein
VTRVEVHPVDVLTLRKGEWLSPDRCEAIVGVRRIHESYRLKLLALGSVIAKQWSDYRDEIVTIKCERDGLLICTDDQAVDENRKRRRANVRGLERAHVRQAGVDTSNLSTKELRELHERECVIGAAFLVGGRREQGAALSAHRRSTPNLIAGKK